MNQRYIKLGTNFSSKPRVLHRVNIQGLVERLEPVKLTQELIGTVIQRVLNNGATEQIAQREQDMRTSPKFNSTRIHAHYQAKNVE